MAWLCVLFISPATILLAHIFTRLVLGTRGRLCGLAVACWTRDHYHPCSNLGVGISEGRFIFDFTSLPL